MSLKSRIEALLEKANTISIFKVVFGKDAAIVDSGDSIIFHIDI